MLVSSAMRDVMEQFNLGASELHPVQLYKNDRKTPMNMQYYCLIFRERKTSFIPEVSQGVKKPPNQIREYWCLNGATKDNDVLLSERALEPPDLWVEERLERCFFLSDALVQELKVNKLTRRLGLRKCVIQRTESN